MARSGEPRLTPPSASASRWIARLAATVGTPAFDHALRHTVRGLGGSAPQGPDGPFAEYYVRQLNGAAELLMTFLRRHAELRAAARQPSGLSPDQALELVGTLHAGLPPREREVCAGILRGLSMKAVARELGIAASSAITYRRRAYRRLGVSSAAGLVARCRGAEREG